MTPHARSSPLSGYQVLTSAGPAAIAVVRLFGRAAHPFLLRHVHVRASQALEQAAAGAVLRAELRDADEVVLDDMLVLVRSGGPDWDVDLCLHGNPVLVRRCTTLAGEAGLTEVPTNDFPAWAGRDRLETEAWDLLPHVLTARGARWLLAQPPALRGALQKLLDAEPATVRTELTALAGRADIVTWFTRPLRVALIGPPNAGKSTMVNVLAGQAGSIVSPQPGTTRDWVEVQGEIDGFPVTWVDTAGLIEPRDALEVAIAESTRVAVASAEATLLVLDLADRAGTLDFVRRHSEIEPTCVVLNKIDVASEVPGMLGDVPADWRERVLRLSAVSGQGVAALGPALLAAAGREPARLEAGVPFTARQTGLLQQAAAEPDPRIRSQRLLELLGP